MDNLDSQTPSQSGSSDLQAQYEALRHLVVSMLILVVVVSGTLNIYLLRQWRSTSKDLTAIRPQAAQMLNDYQRNTGPLMNDFVKKVTEYGRSHPDFVPILTKYGIKLTNSAGVPSAGAATPAPTAPAKK